MILLKIPPFRNLVRIRILLMGKGLYAVMLAGLLNFSCQSERSGSEDAPNKRDFSKWKHYLGDPGRTHYSSLDQINRDNIGQLEVAWTYHSGDPDPQGYIQGSPIIIGEVLYGTSPSLKVFALNAATGEELWKFDPFADTKHKGFTRGLSYWEEGEDKRILFSAERYLYALDAGTGKLVDGFGDNGRVDLTYGLEWDKKGMTYINRSPGTI